MKRFTTYFLLLLTFILCSTGQLLAGAAYPVQLNAQIMPPYTNCLGDLVADNVSRIRVTALLRDMNMKSYNVGIGMKVYQGSQLKFSTMNNHTELVTPNTLHTFNVKDLFTPANVVGRYDGDGYCLKEGGYEFVFQAYDGGNAQLPLSEPVRFFAYLSQAEPPRPIAPANGECVSYNAPVNFVWMEGAVTSFNPNRSYRIEIFELPENMEKTDAKSFISTSSTKFTIDNIPGNLNFYTFQNTAGKLVKGRKYLWRVQLYDKTQQVSDGREVYSSSSMVANGGYSEVYSFSFNNCDPFGKQEENLVDDSKKPILIRVDSSEAQSTVVWKKEPDKYPYGYVVCFNTADDTLSNWAKVEVGPEDSSYTFKNVSTGVRYLTHIIGIVDQKEDGTKTMSANSDRGSFTMPVPVEQECSKTIDAVTSKWSIASLNPGNYITANDRNIKITEVTQTISGNDTLYSGKGVVLCPWMPTVSLITKFENVKINRNFELIKGMVYVPTDKSNCLFVDLDEWTNDQYKGTGPAETQKTSIPEYQSVDQIPEGELGVVDGKLFANEDGKATYIGKVESADKYNKNVIQSNGLDADHGLVRFEHISNWNPPMDGERGEGYYGDVSDYYTTLSTSSDNYSVPWFAMVEGKTKSIKGEISLGKKTAKDVKFVCLVGDQAIVLDAKFDGNYTYTIPIFGGTGETSLDVYALATGENGDNLTLGHARIQNMPKMDQKVILIPVKREPGSIAKDDIEKQLNAIYGPLGITYKVEVADKFDGEELSFLEDGLDVTTTSNWTTSSDEMKRLKNLYAQNHTIDEQAAYIFVCPKATYEGTEVVGDMPRCSQVGYVFSEAATYNDGWTIAHELGHGLYSFEHVFTKEKNKGNTNNLMDYNNGTILKVWQWNLLYSHKNFTIPFLEKDEDGMYKGNKDDFDKSDCPLTNTIGGIITAVTDVFKSTLYVDPSVFSCSTFKEELMLNIADKIFNGHKDALGENKSPIYLALTLNSSLLNLLSYDCLKHVLGSDHDSKSYSIPAVVARGMADCYAAAMFEENRKERVCDCVGDILGFVFDLITGGVSGKIMEKMSLFVDFSNGFNGSQQELENAKINANKYMQECMQENGFDAFIGHALSFYTTVADINRIPRIPTDFGGLCKELLSLNESEKLQVYSKVEGDNIVFYIVSHVQIDSQDPLSTVEISCGNYLREYSGSTIPKKNDLRLSEVEPLTLTLTEYVRGIPFYAKVWDAIYNGGTSLNGGLDGEFTRLAGKPEYDLYVYKFIVPCDDTRDGDKFNVARCYATLGEIHGECYTSCLKEMPKNEIEPVSSNTSTVRMYSGKEDCSETDLFVKKASSQRKANEASEQFRITNGECVYGLPKCSQWKLVKNSEISYDISCTNTCGVKVDNLYNVTLKSKGNVTDKGVRTLNKDVASNHLYEVFKYDEGCHTNDSIIIKRNGETQFSAVSDFISDFALQLYVSFVCDFTNKIFNDGGYIGTNDRALHQLFDDKINDLNKYWDAYKQNGNIKGYGKVTDKDVFDEKELKLFYSAFKQRYNKTSIFEDCKDITGDLKLILQIAAECLVLDMSYEPTKDNFNQLTSSYIFKDCQLEKSHLLSNYLSYSAALIQKKQVGLISRKNVLSGHHFYYDSSKDDDYFYLANSLLNLVEGRVTSINGFSTVNISKALLGRIEKDDKKGDKKDELYNLINRFKKNSEDWFSYNLQNYTRIVGLTSNEFKTLYKKVNKNVDSKEWVRVYGGKSPEKLSDEEFSKLI